MAELAADGDVMSKLLFQRQLTEFAKLPFSEDLDANSTIDPDKAVEWVFSKDCTFAGVSGPTFYRRGQHITYTPMIRQLRDASAPILPVR
jgi:hypothetical protein